MHKPGIGLALGSGGARGWAHIGALRALSELGIRFDVVCGTSIGALVGGFYLTGQLPDLEVWARRLTRLKIIRFMDFGLAKNGLIAGNRLFGEMQRALGEVQIEDLSCPFASVATDLIHGPRGLAEQGVAGRGDPGVLFADGPVRAGSPQRPLDRRRGHRQSHPDLGLSCHGRGDHGRHQPEHAGPRQER